MDSQQAREETFGPVRMREPFLKFRDFAEAGFYYQASKVAGEPDKIQCAFCTLSLANLRNGCNLYLIHAYCFPTCVNLMACKGRAWIRRHTHVNMDQYFVINDGIGQTLLRPLLHAGGQEHRRQSLYITQQVGRIYRTPRGVAYTEPLHSDFSDYERRLESLSDYENISARVGLSFNLNRFAGAGFFWPGNGHDLVCYYCARRKNVEIEVKEDPFEMHVDMGGTCFHLIMEKGEDFIHHVASGNVDRFPVEEENLTTEGPGSTGYCANCGQMQETDSLMCCLTCERCVCTTEECLNPSCCTFPN